MACFSKASPALKEILNKLQSMQIPVDIDHHLYEFGSVHYNIQASASDPSIIYLSISMLPLTPEVMLPHGLPVLTRTGAGCQCVGSRRGLKNLMSFSKSVALRRNCGIFANQIKRIRSRIKIRGLHRFRRHWFRISKFNSFA